ncbi:hypothetical protein POM88_008234 [Heracleum sosnowskyi]|uniref:Uncharacterized protein n=1 Tax=Heracleum sosnowskyi TaxID=360622 RepID=A0AAD8N768_9APIA|nr:hypothetical protein POM88_008234 [Heracleum sosnowskyi]
MWAGSDFWAASLVKNAVSTAERGEALDRRKAGCGMLLEMCLFQYRINEAFAGNGFSLASNLILRDEFDLELVKIRPGFRPGIRAQTVVRSKPSTRNPRSFSTSLVRPRLNLQMADRTAQRLQKMNQASKKGITIRSSHMSLQDMILERSDEYPSV